MISRKLMHQVANRLQLILGSIDLGEIAQDPETRKKHFDQARTHIRQLTDFLNARVQQDDRKKK
jgi:hypothetical protein